MFIALMILAVGSQAQDYPKPMDPEWGLFLSNAEQYSFNEEKKEHVELLLKSTQEGFLLIYPNGSLYGSIPIIDFDYLNYESKHGKFINKETVSGNTWYQYEYMVISVQAQQGQLLIWDRREDEKVYLDPYDKKPTGIKMYSFDFTQTQPE
jgi:hypothetical protein